MSSTYTDLSEKIKGLNHRLQESATKLKAVAPSQRGEYQNPEYRLWSGNLEDIEEFVDRLEEWLSQPPVAEAKRYLRDLAMWAQTSRDATLPEIEKDWRFLTDSVGRLGAIHAKLGAIEYDAIRTRAAKWVLERVVEKDIERAEIWTDNASMFASEVQQIDGQQMKSRLAQKAKEDVVRELLGIASFDSHHAETINDQKGLLERAENLVSSKPPAIQEEPILRTYRAYKRIQEGLSAVGEKLERLRSLLINLEWVVEIKGLKDYSTIWTAKDKTLKKRDLASMVEAFESVEKKAVAWKLGRKKELDSTLAMIDRMARSAEDEELKGQVGSVSDEISEINWNRPDLHAVVDMLHRTAALRTRLREELIGKLHNEDAIYIIEDPAIIQDLGATAGWDFDRFMTALTIILRNGLIQITTVEET